MSYNDTLASAARALRYIAAAGEPAQGGEQSYNTMHLLQIAEELDEMEEARLDAAAEKR